MRPKSGRLRRVGRIALYGVIGFIIGSIVVVGLVEGYGVEKSWRPLDDISPHLIRAATAGEDARFCRHHGFDWGAIATACSEINGHKRPSALASLIMR